MLVPETDLVSFCKSAIGGVQFVNGAMTYVPPLVYARNPGLVCNSAEFEQLGSYYDPTHTPPDFKDFRVTLNFGVPDQPENEDVADWSASLSGEELVFPASNYTNNDTNKKLTATDSPVPLIVPKIELTATYKNQPDFPVGLDTYVGKINASPILGYGAGTIMFKGCETKRSLSADGQTAQEIQYKFQATFPGWNYHYIPASGWVKVTPDRYQSVDLLGVFNL